MKCRELPLDELLPHYSERKNGLPIPLHRDVNASTAEVAEVPREREVICDAIAVLYRGVGGTFRCKNAPKKRIKGALFTVCFIVDNSFCAVYVVEW